MSKEFIAGVSPHEEQVNFLVSDRDRMVTFSRYTGHPHYKNGLELIGTVTVVRDDDGKISIGLGYPGDTIAKVVFIDD